MGNENGEGDIDLVVIQETEMKPSKKAKSLLHLEFWVGNIEQAAFFYRKALGFSLLAKSGPETGVLDRTSYLLQQGRIRLILTSATSHGGEVHDHVMEHGDTVRDIALEVTNVSSWFDRAIHAGARPYREPVKIVDKNGRLEVATIYAFGETTISFIDRAEYKTDKMPGFVTTLVEEEDAGLRGIDHIVVNVEQGQMMQYKQWCQDVLGSEEIQFFEKEDVSTPNTGLRSVVMQTTSQLKININEPTPGRWRSHIQEYLDVHKGSGVQHIALATKNALSTIQQLKKNGVKFHSVTPEYYQELWKEKPPIRESAGDIERVGVLVDFDEDGYLLQQFTHPVQSRATLFYEIIQREGSRGFGKRTFRTHFKEMEEATIRRGYK
jgi:4-hydroxyphenylpyruvate dioxygenase